MPSLLHARPPADPDEQRTLRRLAASRHAPGDWILRARIVVRSWDGERASQTPPGWAVTPRPCGSGGTASTPTVSTGSVTDPVGSATPARPDPAWPAGRLVRQDPTGRLVRQADGTLAAVDPQQPGVWTLDALVQAAHELGIAVERSQVRRILLAEGHAGGTRARGRPVVTQSSSQRARVIDLSTHRRPG